MKLPIEVTRATQALVPCSRIEDGLAAEPTVSKHQVTYRTLTWE